MPIDSASLSHSLGSYPNRLSAPAVRSAVYSFDDLRRVVGKAWLVAEVVGAYHDLVKRRLDTRALAVAHLQLVELEHQVVGRRECFEAAGLADEQHSCDVDAGDQFLRGRGDVGEYVVDFSQRGHPRQLRHAQGEVVVLQLHDSILPPIRAPEHVCDIGAREMPGYRCARLSTPEQT
jgi:hypothetical protein